MNYVKIYNNLINRATTRLLETYTEKHHIVPRCLGGTDDVNNLVALTPEEHYLAHQLLVKMYPNNRDLAFAADLMCYDSQGKRVNNKSFGWIKRKIQEHKKQQVISLEQRAKISKTLTGRTLTDEHKTAIRQGLLDRNYTPSGSTKEKISKKLKVAWQSRPRQFSDETKAKMSQAKKGIAKEQLTCPHCGKTGGRPAMTRWHFDNCKHK